VFTFASNIIKLIRSTDTINIAVEKASRVVKSLNNFSHGNINKEHTLYLLKESIDSAVVILWNKIKYGSNVQIDIANNVIIKGNQDELSQVWINLINNALQASNNNCNIKISHSIKNKYHEIIFSNDGPPIPEDILPKIFDPFFSTKKRGEGTGLGLNIVKKIIEQHNGTIHCMSSTNETSFIIKIPSNHE
jgi:signal transduction histidine kinase